MYLEYNKLIKISKPVKDAKNQEKIRQNHTEIKDQNKAFVDMSKNIKELYSSSTAIISQYIKGKAFIPLTSFTREKEEKKFQTLSLSHFWTNSRPCNSGECVRNASKPLLYLDIAC
ncbi:conserved hypothetical protein [Ricinus communis]|uniref:Uncharacterized protein n=1 Tax=Ricinus communis TaxID=3988 RepID=B9RJI5_RICCO|nr:conserved hypothetical protein [Ricinus communis]